MRQNIDNQGFYPKNLAAHPRRTAIEPSVPCLPLRTKMRINDNVRNLPQAMNYQDPSPATKNHWRFTYRLQKPWSMV